MKSMMIDREDLITVGVGGRLKMIEDIEVAECLAIKLRMLGAVAEEYGNGTKVILSRPPTSVFDAGPARIRPVPRVVIMVWRPYDDEPYPKNVWGVHLANLQIFEDSL